jgi:hypothetical protein
MERDRDRSLAPSDSQSNNQQSGAKCKGTQTLIALIVGLVNKKPKAGHLSEARGVFLANKIVAKDLNNNGMSRSEATTLVLQLSGTSNLTKADGINFPTEGMMDTSARGTLNN